MSKFKKYTQEQTDEYNQKYSYFHRHISNWIDLDLKECRIPLERNSKIADLALLDVLSDQTISSLVRFEKESLRHVTLWEDPQDDYPTFHGYILIVWARALIK